MKNNEQNIYKIIEQNCEFKPNYEQISSRVDTTPKQSSWARNTHFHTFLKISFATVASIVLILVLGAVITIPFSSNKGSKMFDVENNDLEINYSTEEALKKEDVQKFASDIGIDEDVAKEGANTVQFKFIDGELYLVINDYEIKLEGTEDVLENENTPYTIYSKDNELYIEINGKEVKLEDFVNGDNNE